jgi:uncharacterized protein (DUF1330 family)
MVAYLLVDYEVTETGALKAYGQAARPLIEQHGGVYRALDRPAVLEGDPPLRAVALIEFPSMEHLQAFWNSPEYAEVKKLRAGKATFTVRAVQGQ